MSPRSGESESLPTVCVAIATMDRPDFLARCLEHVVSQTVTAAEVIVVDASSDRRSREVVAAFPGVRYLHNALGAGHTAESRQLAYAVSTAEIFACVDDDAFAEPDWLEHLLAPYRDPGVGGVGGVPAGGTPGEESDGLGEIGRLRENGTLSGGFAADPGEVIEVEHLLGANMSFRRAALDHIGGIHGGYPGTCLCEETDIALRVSAAGWRLLYSPAAVVDHVAAPSHKGRRFDVRYDYFAHRNHVVLLIRIFGLGSPRLRGYLADTLISGSAQLRRPRVSGGARAQARNVAAGIVRAAAMFAGVLVGLSAGIRLRAGDAERTTEPC